MSALLDHDNNLIPSRFARSPFCSTAMASFLPTLSSADVQRAAQVSTCPFSSLTTRSLTHRTKLIRESYDPASSHRLSPDEQRHLQNELFELQRRWEAWGLVVPFLFEHADPNVQFFGAHTAQVKISRDWYAADTCPTPPDPHPRPLRLHLHRESLPTAHSDQLVPFLLNITRPSIVLGLSKVILRKFFVTVCLCSHYHPFSFIH